MDSEHIGDHHIGSEYADHLTEADFRLLASATRPPLEPAELRRNPGRTIGLFGRPEVFDALFGAGAREQGLVIGASAFLAFAVAVHRLAAELDWAGRRLAPSDPRHNIAVPDAHLLRDFLGSPARRLFLAELLTSFTLVRTDRRYVGAAGQGQSGSELDPVELAVALDTVDEPERPGIYRRLGDVALFVSGVFPDQATRFVFGPLQSGLFFAASVVPADEWETGTTPSVVLLERLGARWYRTAYELAPARSTRLTVVAEVAERFSVARQVLNQVARRYLFVAGNLPWFRPPRP